MTNDLKWLISSDQQIPYHDKRALDLYFQVMKAWRPDVIDLVGDQSDQFCFSRWSEGRPQEFLEKYKRGEIDDILTGSKVEERPVAEFYAQHRKMRKNAEIFVALGNHDVRAFDYFEKKIPSMMNDVTPESLWGLDSLGIDYIYYSDRPKHRYGGIHAHHGMSISKHAGESVRNDIDNFGISMVRGHSHRLASYAKSYPLRNEIVRGWELGHMMDINCGGASYDNVHNWQQGFAIGHIESGADTPDGYYVHIQLVEISPDYVCYVDGKKFQA
jgi:hypothetical protein